MHFSISVMDQHAHFYAGLKYWKTNKTVKAMSLNLYNKLRGVQQSTEPSLTEPGPSRQLSVVGDNYTVRTQSPVQISDSESDTVVTVRKKRKLVPTPPSDSESVDAGMISAGKLNEIISKLNEIKEKMNNRPSPYQQLADIFTCLICADDISESSEPVVPTCCRNVVYCRECLDHWLTTNTVCPHCRAPLLSVDSCHTLPIIRPLFELLRTVNSS